MPTLEAHFITFTAEGIGSLRILKGDGSPKVTGGHGGWNVTNRPHRRGLTTWDGVEPYRMSIPVVFEGWPDVAGQEIRIGTLSRMATPQGDDEPPRVSISGIGIPSEMPKKNWVIESLEWGDNVLWDNQANGSMVRLRQDCTVNLLQYVNEDRVAFSKLSSAQPGAGAWPKHHVWRKGDTLQRLASRFYKNSKKWKRIADANNIRDPKHIRIGRILRIPKP
jgi:LysM domain